MPNKKLPDFPSVTTLQNNDIFLIESAATTSTVSYGTLSSSIINNTPRVNSVAIGTIAYIAATTPPAGYLECNGSAVSVSVYTDLTNAIYCGDGNNATASFGYRCTDSASPSTSRSTTGNFIVLPDLRGEFIRGWDNGSGVDSGRIFGSNQSHALQDHGHNLNPNATYSVDDTPNNSQANFLMGDPTAETSNSFTALPTINNQNYIPNIRPAAGINISTETRPRNVALLPCIYAYNANLTQTAIDVASLINFFNSEINKINARITLTEFYNPTGLFIASYRPNENNLNGAVNVAYGDNTWRDIKTITSQAWNTYFGTRNPKTITVAIITGEVEVMATVGRSVSFTESMSVDTINSKNYINMRLNISGNNSDTHTINKIYLDENGTCYIKIRKTDPQTFQCRIYLLEAEF